MTSLGLVTEDAIVPVIPKEAVVVQVAQVTALSPILGSEKMGNLGVLSLNVDSVNNVNAGRSEAELQLVNPLKKYSTNKAKVRRTRSPSPRLHRTTSLGVLKPDGRRTEDSARRREERVSGLRLPSFRGLGISSLEPSYLSRARHAPGQQGSSPSSSQTQSSGSRPRPSSTHQHASESTFGSTPLLTPPEDTASIKWNNALHTSSSAVSRCEKCNTDVNITNVVNSMSVVSVAGEPSTTSGPGPPQPDQSNQNHSSSASSEQQSGESDHGSQPWLSQAVQHAVSSTGNAANPRSTVQVIAHVLPLPAEDSSPHHEVFTSMVQAIQGRYGPDHQPYIQIYHAVPHKFDLNSLPTSPPATPNIGHTGSDYFSNSIFAHAAVVPSYHAVNRGLHASTSSTPNTIVPPQSVQTAMLERYIPPTSTREYNDFFSTRGRSVLVDRLTELSTDNGTLMFIYPTKAGARTFSSRYLGPVLNPILLHIVNLNRLVFDLAEDIGTMGAIPDMSDFDGMQAKIHALCERMSSNTRFNLVHSSTGRVRLDQSTWREWYIEQEQGRIREVLKSYWKQGRRLPGDTEVTDATIARAIIDGLRKGVKHGRLAAGELVEVGVFVIRRTPASA